MLVRLTLAAALLTAGLICITCGGGAGKPPAAPMGATEFSLSSAAFVKEYQANQNAAHNKYNGKVIELTGKVATITDHGDPHFWLEGPDPADDNPARATKAYCQMATARPWN